MVATRPEPADCGELYLHSESKIHNLKLRSYLKGRITRENVFRQKSRSTDRLFCLKTLRLCKIRIYFCCVMASAIFTASQALTTPPVMLSFSKGMVSPFSLPGLFTCSPENFTDDLSKISFT